MKKMYMFLTLSYVFWGLLIKNVFSLYFCNVFEFLGNFKSLIKLEQYKVYYLLLLRAYKFNIYAANFIFKEMFCQRYIFFILNIV